MHQEEEGEGGKEEEGERASADLHHPTAETDTQVSLHIFTNSISRRFSAYGDESKFQCHSGLLITEDKDALMVKKIISRQAIF